LQPTVTASKTPRSRRIYAGGRSPSAYSHSLKDPAKPPDLFRRSFTFSLQSQPQRPREAAGFIPAVVHLQPTVTASRTPRSRRIYAGGRSPSAYSHSL